MVTELPVYENTTQNMLSKLKMAIDNCYLCSIAYNITNRVYWKGNTKAPVLIIGEAPGVDEDKEGIPFVGKCGKKLDQILNTPQVNLPETHYCVTNVLKCWPGRGNPSPSNNQTANCSNFLERFIRLVNPSVILCLGFHAAKCVTKSNLSSLRAMKLQNFLYGEIPIVLTYHPSYILRNSMDIDIKVGVWKDIQKAVLIARNKNPEAFIGLQKPTTIPS